jgi:hypothetical protein
MTAATAEISGRTKKHRRPISGHRDKCGGPTQAPDGGVPHGGVNAHKIPDSTAGLHDLRQATIWLFHQYNDAEDSMISGAGTPARKFQ